jgi:RND family efflux transporter MFP subunit
LQWRTARARYEAAKNLRETYASETPAESPQGGPARVELRAPISGILDAVESGPGELVQAQEPLFVILDLETLWIEARVPEADLSRMNEAATAIYEVPGQKGEYTAIADQTGHLVHLGREVEPRTRTVPVIYEINNAGGRLRAGQYVNLQAQTHRVVDAMAVPEEAIVDEDGRPVVFVHVSGETFEKRELTLGIRDGPWVQALSGLSAGERVATRGAYAVRLASVSTTIPAHGHVH